MIKITIIIVFILFTCCQYYIELINPKQDIIGVYTHYINFDGAVYYLDGLQQAKPPEGSFNRHARVRMVRNSGSYSLVESETGISAFVSSGSLDELSRK